MQQYFRTFTLHIYLFLKCSLVLSLGYGGIIAAGEVTPILPVAGEKQPDNITKFFFDALLQFVVSEVLLILIDTQGFSYLFEVGTRGLLNLGKFHLFCINEQDFHLKLTSNKSVYSLICCTGPYTVKTLYNVTSYNRIFNIRHNIAGNESVSIKILSL